jgi:streptomycin 6-kinase
MNVPRAFVKNFTDLNGDAGKVWLEQLPQMIKRLEQRWNMKVLEHFPNLTYNFVAPAVRDNGVPVVLKLGFPEELELEAKTLRAYDGDGAVRLLEHDPKVEAMLLEKLEPGEPLPHFMNNEENTRVTAVLLKRLWRKVNSEHFRTLDSWTRALHETHEKYQRDKSFKYFPLLHKAVQLYQEHRHSEQFLLHADLHHDNILTAKREPYLSIDPKGIVGAKGFDIGTFLINPVDLLLGFSEAGKIHQERVHIFSEMLSMTREEVEAWGFIFAVLSGCWRIGEHSEGWDEAMRAPIMLYA